MSEKQIDICSFCGSHKDERKKLIVSGDVAICDYCTNLCHDLVLGDAKPESSEGKADGATDNSLRNVDAIEIKKYLDEYVIGQDKAKKILSVAIANHYKRITNPNKDIEIQKGNVLLMGPTGSGKTLLAKTAAKFLKVPFVIADATSLTEAGYVGDDVESMISMLVNAAGGDISLAEKGIIFVDEIDKIARKSESTSITRDVSGEGVQQALLKLVEGTTCRIPAAGGRKHPDGNMLMVDTKNILFVAGGAFVGLEEIIKRRMKGSTIGFSAEVKSVDDHISLDTVTPDDLTKFGLIPEFVGRFATTISVEDLNKEQLVKVLTSVKNNYISQYTYLFQLDGIDLKFDKKSIEQIAKNCLDLKTGARGLQTEVERVLMPHMFNVSRYRKKGIKEINISQELVNNPVELI
jgi:ATP-dependent Clp protease ATP-binding subunit ClpX